MKFFSVLWIIFWIPVVVSVVFGLYSVSRVDNAVAGRIDETTLSRFSEDASRLFKENPVDDLVEFV